MKFRKDFIGLDGFQWWFGVVENRNDPQLLGRCQVRIFGIHTGDLTDIPSEDLPWALPVQSLNNQTFSTPKEGDYVFGFFVDGPYAQQPIMMGIVPGIPQSSSDPNFGFADPRSPADILNSPKKPRSIQYAADGTGAEIEEVTDEAELADLRNPSVFQIGYPTNSGLARNEQTETTVLTYKQNSTVTVPTPGDNSWQEPDPGYDAEYPFNKVWETESGHVMEFDDTPGSERVHIAHRSGSFQEIYPSGTKVEKIVKNNYKIIFSDDHVYVKGRVNLTVESNVNMKVFGHVNLEAHNDINANVAGSVNYTVGGDFNIKAENINLESNSALQVLSNNSILMTAKSEDGGFFASSPGIVAMQGGDVSILGDISTSISADIGELSLSAGGAVVAEASGAVSLLGGGEVVIQAGEVASVTGATVGLNGEVIAATSVGPININGATVFLGDQVIAPLQVFTTVTATPVTGVPVPGTPAGPAQEATATGLGDPLPLSEYNDPPVFFEKSPGVRLPEDRQADIDNQTIEYIKNPRAFYNGEAAAGGVKENYRGTPDTTGAGNSYLNQNNPNTTDGSDLKAWLDEQLSKTNANAFWLETGMGGQPSNPNILNIWRDLGFGNKGAWGSDQTAWCMGFVNYGLKQNGYRYVQTASAFDIRNRLSAYNATQILNPRDAQSGDIALWSYGHVSFVYENSGGALRFVGGNQKCRNNNGGNNPTQGDVSISWGGGYVAPGDGTLIGIFRPSKT